MNYGMNMATIKGIKADYVKRTITLTLEASLDDFKSTDRDAVAQWADMGLSVDVVLNRHMNPAPLLDAADNGR